MADTPERPRAAAGAGGGLGVQTHPVMVHKTSVLVGAFRDYRGAVATFYFDAATGALAGPMLHSAPAGKVAAGPPPPSLPMGTVGDLEYEVQMAPLQKGPPPESGRFVAFTARGEARTPASLLAAMPDPYALGLLAVEPRLRPAIHARSAPTDLLQSRALFDGLLLAGDRDGARALLAAAGNSALLAIFTDPRYDSAALGPLLLDGLAGVAHLDPAQCKKERSRCHPLYFIGPVAQAWLAGDRKLARRRVHEAGLGRAIHVDEPVGEPKPPLEGAPFDPRTRFAGGSWPDAYADYLSWVAPDFSQFLQSALREERAAAR